MPPARGGGGPSQPWLTLLSSPLLPPFTVGALDRWKDGDRPLRDYVEAAAADTGPDGRARLLAGVLRRVSALVSSPDPADRLAGVLAVDELVPVRSLGEPAARVAACAGCLQHALAAAGPGEAATLEAAAVAMGHLARAGGPRAADAVEAEVRRALGWLREGRTTGGSSAGLLAQQQAGRAGGASPSSHAPFPPPTSSSLHPPPPDRRLAAALVLRALAESAPAVFNVHVRSFIDAVWAGLRDPRPPVRAAAVGALRSCLVLVEARETRYRVQWYYRLFEEARRGLAAAGAPGGGFGWWPMAMPGGGEEGLAGPPRSRPPCRRSLLRPPPSPHPRRPSWAPSWPWASCWPTRASSCWPGTGRWRARCSGSGAPGTRPCGRRPWP